MAKFGKLVMDRARRDPEFKRQVLRELRKRLAQAKKNKDADFTVPLVRAIISLEKIK